MNIFVLSCLCCKNTKKEKEKNLVRSCPSQSRSNIQFYTFLVIIPVVCRTVISAHGLELSGSKLLTPSLSLIGISGTFCPWDVLFLGSFFPWDVLLSNKSVHLDWFQTADSLS